MRLPRWGSPGPKTALPLSTTPSKAGGRWLALGRWPKWRRVVLENGLADAVYHPVVTGVRKTALPLLTTHPRRAVDGFPLEGGQNGDGRIFENGSADAV